MQQEEGPGQPVASEPIKRTRLDPVKTNQSVNFIAGANFIQDVAYATKELKLACCLRCFQNWRERIQC